MKRVNLFLVLVVLCMVLSMAAEAAVIYVKTDGNNTNNGSSWGLAKKTVTAALTASVSGVRSGWLRELMLKK